MSGGNKTKWRWYYWLVLLAAAFAVVIRHVLYVGIVIALTAHAIQRPTGQARLWAWGLKRQIQQVPAPPMNPGNPPPEIISGLATNAVALRTAAELFNPTNVWDVHLLFTSNQWAALEPHSVAPVLNFMQPDGSVILRNPAATRAGLAGILGVDLPWSQGDVRFGNLAFTNVAIRFKGNGTFVNSVRGYKRPFKAELNKPSSGQQLAERTTLNFHNLVADRSCLCDALASEFFREAGLPAARTAFVRMRLSIEGRFDDRLLGLYALVENPDAQWARDQFGVKGVLLFKPVTEHLFADLGDDWSAYVPIYDPKTKTTPAQERRLIALARLVSRTDDAAFAAHIGEFIDLPEFAGFLAGQVLLANYDSILSNGQNFLLYLDPRTDRFGFIPWDHDHCWGQFPLIGSAEDRAHASLRHPWVGENRFLARALAVPAFKQLYEAELKRLRDTLFVPERLSRRVDELAAVIRPLIDEESADRFVRFERAVVTPSESNARRSPDRTNLPALPLKEFFAERAASVSDQLAGRSEGVILKRRPLR